MSAENILAGYIPRPELAKQLDKNERTLARWQYLKIGPPVTLIGREPWYRVEAVRKWLSERERPSVRERRRTGTGASCK